LLNLLVHKVTTSSSRANKNIWIVLSTKLIIFINCNLPHLKLKFLPATKHEGTGGRRGIALPYP